MQDIDLSLESLRHHQEQAIGEWQSAGEATPLLRVWTNIHRAWVAADKPVQDLSLGHIAVFWQELNEHCGQARVLPLINQFIHVSFKRITHRTPRDFSPSLAADAAAWHVELHAVVRSCAESNSESKRAQLDATLTQYASLFHHRLRANATALVTEQLPELQKAGHCLSSSLYLVDPVDWDDPQGSGIIRLLDLLGDVCFQSAAVHGGWEPEEQDPNAVRALFGFWGSRAKWFHQVLSLYQVDLLPRYVWPPAPSPSALPSAGEGDQNVLLVASAAAGRKWLVASVSESKNVPLSLHALRQGDVQGVRDAWALGEPVPEPTTLPEFGVVASPAGLCRLACWEIPGPYYWHDESNLGASSEADAAMVRTCRETIRAQQPAAALAIFDWKQIHTASPQSVSTPYVNAATQMAALIQHRGGDPGGFSWNIVLDGAAPISTVGAEGAQAQLVTDYERAVRGLTTEGYNPIVILYGKSAAEFIAAAAAHPLSSSSPAFGRRLAFDLRRLETFLENLAAHGFFTISVSYTDSTPDQAAQWLSFSNVWSLLHHNVAAATLSSRSAQLERHFVSELGEHVLSDPTQAGLGAVVKTQSQLWVELSTGGLSRSDPSLSGLWDELKAEIGARDFTASDFESLWSESEAHQKNERAIVATRRECLDAILSGILEALGIPMQRVSDFSWSGSVSSVGAPQTEDWEALLALGAKAQPLSPEDPVLTAVRPLYAAYDNLLGSQSEHCLLKDHGPDDATRTLLYEHGSRVIGELLCFERVSLDEKARLLLTLKGYAPCEPRATWSFRREERNYVKHAVIQQLRQDALSLDLLLIHMARVTIEAGVGLGANDDPQTLLWENRREQLLRLLDAGGWQTESISEDPAAALVALRRLIQLWKDFYRTRSPHRMKQRQARAEALTTEYERLCKPLAVPAIHTSTPMEEATANERSAYLAAYCVELLGRIPAGPAGRPSQAEVQDGASPSHYPSKINTLVEAYSLQRSRLLVRAAAHSIEQSQWLRGFGPDLELIGRDIIAEPQSDPRAQAQRIIHTVTKCLEIVNGHAAQSQTVGSRTVKMDLKGSLGGR